MATTFWASGCVEVSCPMTTELYIEAVNSTALSFSNVLLLCSDKLKDGEEPEPADSKMTYAARAWKISAAALVSLVLELRLAWIMVVLTR